MKNKQLAGIAFIALALLFINIIPDPSDVITLQVYSAFTGADVNPSNLSVVYLDFIVWSLFVGLGLLFVGLYLMGWNLKRLWKKLDIDKYGMAILFAIISVLFVSFFKINSVWLVFSIVPIIYWFYVHKDKSECLGLFITSWILWVGGLSTLASFIFNRIPIPEVITSLNNNIFLMWLAITLGFSQVTNTVLVSGVFISFLLVILLAKVLKENF